MITIVGDTLSCIPPQEASELGIQYVPQIIIFGEETYRDDYEIDSKTFLQKLTSSQQLPKTAAPPPALYTPIFEKFATPGNTVIVLCPPAGLSGTYRSASVAAQDFPGAEIRIIDTKIIASGLGILLKQALTWSKMQWDANQIVDSTLEMASKWRVYFLVDTLEYLQKGGRIGPAKALLGSLLQVKPILTLREGVIAPAESQRTKKRALARLAEFIEQDAPDPKTIHLSVMHAGAEEEAIMLAKSLERFSPGQPVWMTEVPPAIVVHAGPGVLAVGYFVS